MYLKADAEAHAEDEDDVVVVVVLVVVADDADVRSVASVVPGGRDGGGGCAKNGAVSRSCR